MQKKSSEGLSVKKDGNFSEWYTQVVEKAEITDIRYSVKGFVVIRPWGAMIIENMYSLYEKALQNKSHKPTFFPTLIPEKNYSDLEIGNGGDASLQYFYTIHKYDCQEKIENIRNHLLLYCCQDTLSMYDILEHIRGLVK